MNESMRFTANTATKKGTAFSAFCARGGHASVRLDKQRGWPKLKKARLSSNITTMRRGLRTTLIRLSTVCAKLSVDPVLTLAYFLEHGELPPVEKPK